MLSLRRVTLDLGAGHRSSFFMAATFWEDDSDTVTPGIRHPHACLTAGTPGEVTLGVPFHW